MNVVDINKILHPVSEGQPCGIPAENLPQYEIIRQYRESDEEGMDDQQGWSYQPRKADWLKVKALCLEMLESQSKDLEILCWLAQALLQSEGIKGATEGVTLITWCFSQYWETLHPVEGHDFAFRESHLNGLDRLFSGYLLRLPLDDEHAITLFNWKRVQIFEQRVAAKADTRERLLKEGYLSLQDWQKRIAVVEREQVTAVKEQCIQLNKTIEVLDAFLQQQCGEPYRGFWDTRGKIRELLSLVSRFYPDPINGPPQEAVSDGMTEMIIPDPGPLHASAGGGAGQGQAYYEQRIQATRELEKIITLFRENEPGSPVPYLLERAIRWMTMSTIEWMADIFGEETSHYMDGLNTLFGPTRLREHQKQFGERIPASENQAGHGEALDYTGVHSEYATALPFQHDLNSHEPHY
ncbi:type VI secretion system protein TssA [Salmonella enterica]|nr:type VI secretion system protein TssA [Salmonella enterica]EGM2982961.1 type VI secretion system protein TssA [Salmonella enterica]